MAKWKVHVENFECDSDDRVGLLLENLRYAGVVGNVESEYNEEVTRETFRFDIYAPKGVDEKIWAEMNAKRMRSMIIKAEAQKWG